MYFVHGILNLDINKLAGDMRTDPGPMTFEGAGRFTRFQLPLGSIRRSENLVPCTLYLYSGTPVQMHKCTTVPWKHLEIDSIESFLPFHVLQYTVLYQVAVER